MEENELDRPPTPGEEGRASLEEARAVLLAGSRCLGAIADQLGDEFVAAVDAVLSGTGMLVTTGIGKAGHIATKVSATFASTGTPSFFLHPTEAVHGDLGRVSSRDVVLLFSNSGRSQELVRLIPALRRAGATLVAMTGTPDAVLATEADIVLCYGQLDEAGHLGLAPTTSTTAMLGLGDALAMAVFRRRDFTPREFARFHPAGALGRSLTRVRDVMRHGERNPVVDASRTVLEALHVMGATPGRPGATSVVDDDGRLVGFFTDGDYRRLAEAGATEEDFGFMKEPIRDHMTRDPRAIEGDALVADATRVMSELQIDQLPVVDENHRPVGLIDVQDLLDVKGLS